MTQSKDPIGGLWSPSKHVKNAKGFFGSLKPKKPKATSEQKALAAAQARELDRQSNEINERKRRILRSQIGGRSSLLSGSERGIRPGEVRQVSGSSTTATAGRSGIPRVAGLGGGGSGGAGSRGGGGRRGSIF